MRKVLGALVVLVAWFGLSACQPAPTTLTATPSTTKPKCREVTTVTGKVNPANKLRQVQIDMQKPNGEWVAWLWFKDGDSGREVIQADVKSDGSYTTSYFSPVPSSPQTTRLRMHGINRATSTDVVSKSWYVTRPTDC